MHKSRRPMQSNKRGGHFLYQKCKIGNPPGESICIFALGSILQPVAGAIIKNKDGEGILDLLQEWQCPDPLAKVIFKIKEI